MTVDEIRTINDGYINEYLKNHSPSYGFKDFPKRDGNVVISCMDPRCNPNEFWGISETNPKMAVLRNAGGRVGDDTLRSLRVLGGILGYGDNSVSAVAVVHHTDCGMTHFRNEEIGAKLVEHAKLDGERAKEAKSFDYGEITDLEATVWEDMRKIKADPYLPKDLGVIGYVWDSRGNRMTEVGTL